MATVYLVIRTILELISVTLFAYLVFKTYKSVYLILELQSILVLMVRTLDIYSIYNPLRELMLTLTGVTMLSVAVIEIVNKRKVLKNLYDARDMINTVKEEMG